VLSQRLQSVRQRIRQACERSGRPPSAVTLVGVTKGIGVDAIREAIGLGLTDLGENRVQEARQKIQAFPDAGAQPVRWHLIGHLQRNKVRAAVTLFDVVHSVDSAELVDDLERQAAVVRGTGHGVGGRGTTKPLEVFIQMNISGEGTKFGCRPDETIPLVQQTLQQPHLSLRGLMTIAPFSNNPEDARPFFRELRVLRDELQADLSFPVPRSPSLQLSMGMSHDFEIAIEEGADLVRVGTAIFGDRGVEP